MRAVGVAALVLLLCGGAWGAEGSGPGSAELAAAREALTQNLALGDSLQGAAATEAQAGEAQRLVAEGLEKARGVVAVQPRSAEARRLVGALLVLAYRPVESKVKFTDSATGEVVEQTLRTLRRGSEEDREEGLAELRTAAKLAPANVDYQLDYVEGLLAAGQARRSGELATALWQRKGEMGAAQQARGARLGAQAAQSQKQVVEEVRWLKELAQVDPQDEGTRKRLAELAPLTGIVWQTYDAGMRTSRSEGKPAMIHFTAVWCGWCKKMDREVYPQPEVIALASKFSCIKVDGDRQPDVTQRYGVTGYPTIVFLDPQGGEVNRVVGFRDARALLAEMRKALPGG